MSLVNLPCRPTETPNKFVKKYFSDLAKGNDLIPVIALRYFNPIGAHSSGKLENSAECSTKSCSIYHSISCRNSRANYCFLGNDYPTKDGTCVRDYIHVEDLAEAHVSALKYLKKSKNQRL
ncbi:MAG: hypothetical protein CM15mP32_0770 [Flavobacteriaceae bacterium]|nr:MAG: hypothetical protein CM15mP32_0770 [Flavobacteriaceae bacterium]